MASSSDPQLSIVIPLYNEAAGVVGVVEGLLAALAPLEFELILVDNGSTDATPSLVDSLAAQHPRIKVIHLTPNRGYGGGILAGMAITRGEVIGYMWGDAQISPGDVPHLYDHLVVKGLDMCKAHRRVRLDGWQRKLQTRVYHQIFPLFGPCVSQDLHGGPRFFKRDVWKRLEVVSQDWFIDVETLLKMEHLGLRWGEVDVVFYPRRRGYSKVRLSTVGEFLANLWRMKMGRHPAFK